MKQKSQRNGPSGRFSQIMARLLNGSVNPDTGPAQRTADEQLTRGNLVMLCVCGALAGALFILRAAGA